MFSFLSFHSQISENKHLENTVFLHNQCKSQSNQLNSHSAVIIGWERQLLGGRRVGQDRCLHKEIGILRQSATDIEVSQQFLLKFHRKCSLIWERLIAFACSEVHPLSSMRYFPNCSTPIFCSSPRNRCSRRAHFQNARIYLWILHVQKAYRDVTRVPNIFWKMFVSEIWEFSLFLSDHSYRMVSVSIFDFFIFWVFKHRLFCCLSFELSIFWEGALKSKVIIGTSKNTILDKKWKSQV